MRRHRTAMLLEASEADRQQAIQAIERKDQQRRADVQKMLNDRRHANARLAKTHATSLARSLAPFESRAKAIEAIGAAISKKTGHCYSEETVERWLKGVRLDYRR